MNKHGQNSAGYASKSKFTISDQEVKDLLQRKDVVKSPVKIDPKQPKKFYREVDVGKNIGTIYKDEKKYNTSKITIITDRLGNLINTYPGTINK